MFVKGLYYKNTGDFPKAMTNFKNAHTLDSGFIEAKREALSLKENYRSNQEKTFSGEITSVVSNLFGKKRR